MAIHHAEAGEVVDLRPLGGKLKETKTTAITKADHFEAIRLIVPAGASIDPHAVAGDLTLLCLEGRIKLGLTMREIELVAGEWLYLTGGETHSVKGLEDSSLLLTILLKR
ncbi:MAG: cupin [Proteobacteria bacterium]|nr:cupin [Pseudomonadota bacterium]